MLKIFTFIGVSLLCILFWIMIFNFFLGCNPPSLKIPPFPTDTTSTPPVDTMKPLPPDTPVSPIDTIPKDTVKPNIPPIALPFLNNGKKLDTFYLPTVKAPLIGSTNRNDYIACQWQLAEENDGAMIYNQDTIVTEAIFFKRGTYKFELLLFYKDTMVKSPIKIITVN